MGKLKACIFDLDGVVVDTAKYHYIAWKKLGARYGIEFTKEHNENLKGVSRVNSLKYLLSLGNVIVSEEEMITLAQDKNEIYLSYVDQLTQSDVLPGVLPLLKEMRANRIGTAIGSASKNARSVLDKLQIVDYFDYIIDGNDTTYSKPDPEVFILAAKKLGTDDVVVFEDAPKGVDAAIAANYYVVGIGEESSLSHADHIIPNFENFGLSRLLEIYPVNV